MKRRTISQIAITVFVVFALLTGYIMVYAYHHRDVSELVYLIFNSYAIVALLLGLIFVWYWQHAQTRRREQSRKSMVKLMESLASPAMLWNDTMDTVILNSTLLKLSELTKPAEGFDAKHTVPWLFGQKLLTETQIESLLQTQNGEYSFTTKTGVQHDIIWNTAGIEKDENGVTWYLSIGLDLADIRRMQSELDQTSRRLAASEGRHALTMELTDVGMLLIEQGNPNMFPSDKLCDMLGLESDTITMEELRGKVYPLDLTLFDNHVQTMVLHMRDYLEKTGVLEIRLCAANGQYRWYSYRFKATQRTDTGRLIVGGSIIDITQEKEKDQRIERLAYEDSVTGIPNRNGLMKMGSDLYQCTQELGAVYWVIALDIDRFHIINDTCGYENGNALLKGFAEVLKKQLKLGGFGARISGDNFALILRDSEGEDLPAKVVGRIQRSLATLAVGPFENRALTCSAGYAKMPADGSSFEEVLDRAEFALSMNKNINGSIDRYTPQMHDSIVEESLLEKQLADGVMNGQLELYYQPKIALDTGRIVGMEALIRWQHPDGHLIAPSVFVPIAERSMLITQITRYVLDEACRQTKLWQKLGLPEIVVSVNMSSTDFYQDNICSMVQRALKHNELDPKYLEIELTESLAIKDIEGTVARMNALREAGIGIAMDDFGTGYSSLSYIQMLPFTVVKLDRSFVVQMEQDPVIEEIVDSVVRIAKTKGIHTIAEGVETKMQAQMLREFGCEQVQGFLFGKPMPAKEAEAFMRENAKQHGGQA